MPAPKPTAPAYVSIRQHTSAYVSIRQPSACAEAHRTCIRQHTSAQHTSAYVSIRQPSACAEAHRTCIRPRIRPHIRQQTSAYVSTRQHTSAYVSIRQSSEARLRRGLVHLSVHVAEAFAEALNNSRVPACVSTSHTSAYVSIRQHTSAYVSTRQHTSQRRSRAEALINRHSSTLVIRHTSQHTSAYVSIRQHTRSRAEAIINTRVPHDVAKSLVMRRFRLHTSAYVSIRQHTSAYVSIRQHTMSPNAFSCAAFDCRRISRVRCYTDVC